MDTGKVYFDSEGAECSIWQMVKREPTWAAVRIQEGEKAIDEIAILRQQLAETLEQLDRPRIALLQERTELRQQLAEANEKNECVRQANLDVMMHFEDMKAAKEKAEARVAELAAKAHNLSFGIVSSLTDEQQEPFAKQFAELQDCIAAQSSETHVLRKQAEAVEQYANALAMWLNDLPGSPCASFVEGIRSAAEQADRQAQRLRQQADEAERAGGEK